MILNALRLAARYEYGNGLLYVLSPSGKGKSHTVKLITNEHPTKCIEIPPGSETYVIGFLQENVDKNMFVVDDVRNWSEMDFKSVCQYLKKVFEGQISPARCTRFTKNFQKIPIHAAAVLLANIEQANDIERDLRTTGFLERSLKIVVTNTSDEYNRIMDEYVKNEWDMIHTFPRLRVPEGFYRTRGDNKIAPEVEEWIRDNFKGEQMKTVRLIAKVTNKDGFEQLKPCLISGITGKDFYEFLDFEVVNNAT